MTTLSYADLGVHLPTEIPTTQDVVSETTCRSILTEASFATVQVRTLNSVYVIVRRGATKIVVCPDQTVIVAQTIVISHDRMVVLGDDLRTLLTTSPIQTTHVVEN